MRWRTAILTGLLAAALGLTFAPSANADPPSWAGRWYNHNQGYGGYSGRRDPSWRHEHGAWHGSHPNPYWSRRYGQGDRDWNRWYGYRDRYRHRDGDRWYGRRDYYRDGCPRDRRGNPWWYGRYDPFANR